MPDKPRLLFFSGPWKHLGTRLHKSYIEPFDKLLRHFFEVVTIEGDCDYAQCVEAHRPDMALFHSGAEFIGEKFPKISNTHMYRDIPRAGYIWRDPYTPTRVPAMQYLEGIGVDQWFTTFRAGECSSAFKGAIHVPFYVDSGLFHDYGMPKDIPVLLSGAGWAGDRLYPWRTKVCRNLVRSVPVFIVPTVGNKGGEMYTGENYARLINRCCVAPACGSVARIMLAKFFEIPACRTCLVTEDAEVVRQMGFEDGVNCLFSSGDEDIAGRITKLLSDPGELQRIIDAGYNLVHKRHGIASRSMILDWYTLWKRKGAGEVVLQTSPFAPLELADRARAEQVWARPVDNPVWNTILEGYGLILKGQGEEAKAVFERSLEMISYGCEASTGMGLAHALCGNWADAMNGYSSFFAFMKKMKLQSRDPVITALYCVAAAKLDNVKEAVMILSASPEARHPALDSARGLFLAMFPQLAEYPVYAQSRADCPPNQSSVIPLDPGGRKGWDRFLSRMLAK
jgi:hypothetical protein